MYIAGAMASGGIMTPMDFIKTRNCQRVPVPVMRYEIVSNRSLNRMEMGLSHCGLARDQE